MNISDRDVVVATFCRTPLGKFNGSLKNYHCTELGAHAIKGALAKVDGWIKPTQVEEVYMGNVYSANLGQAPARQAALKAGLPESVPCTTVNKVCASGMKATMLGAMSIMTGIRQVVCVGGMESMSQVPHYLTQMRSGKRLGDAKVIDGLLQDGLVDVYSGLHMSQCAEKSVSEHNITREEQDEFSLESCRRVEKNQHFLQNEISPIGNVKHDEMTAPNPDKIKKLKPIFENGTITPGSAPSLADGAACIILCSGAYYKKHAPKSDSVLVLRAFDDAAHNSVYIATSPTLVIPKLLKRMNLSVDQIDAWEINEAFACVTMINQKMFNINKDKINTFGGSVSIGHPFGCTGCRITTTLCNVLNVKKGRYGVAALCNGGGGASGVLIERLEIGKSRL
ncbi:acetyl-CoA C-acetyltransferase [Acrasis kona]|uniref:acetyl-CoA C-acetyltransferase n=1 Tax=Acrasis kona TaxID=1008807 RepID=A0AAW2YNL8_9EUKA